MDPLESTECMVDTHWLLEWLNNKADNFVISSNALFRFEVIKYLRSQLLLVKILPANN
jgi:hypothetical protein